MPKRTIVITNVESLRSVFSIDPDIGALIHRIGTRKSAAGTEAGYTNNIGYRQVAFRGSIYSVHRIAWVLYYGVAPDGEVDHINGDRSDNRKSNLRLATSAQNNHNRKLSSRNKTGIKGVFRVKRGKPWRVSIGHDRGKYYITQFECFGQAVKHANTMRAKIHSEFANTGMGG